MLPLYSTSGNNMKLTSLNSTVFRSFKEDLNKIVKLIYTKEGII